MGQQRRRRRVWDDDEKRQIVAQTKVPGVSVAQVARRYGANANMVFKWLRDPRFSPSKGDVCRFLPVEVLVEPGPPVTGPGPTGEAKIEIALSTGHRRSVIGAFDPDAVSRLVRGMVG